PGKSPDARNDARRHAACGNPWHRAGAPVCAHSHAHRLSGHSCGPDRPTSVASAKPTAPAEFGAADFVVVVVERVNQVQLLRFLAHRDGIARGAGEMVLAVAGHLW